MFHTEDRQILDTVVQNSVARVSCTPDPKNTKKLSSFHRREYVAIKIQYVNATWRLNYTIVLYIYCIYVYIYIKSYTAHSFLIIYYLVASFDPEYGSSSGYYRRIEFAVELHSFGRWLCGSARPFG